jgi:MSHA biogenesis protein MshQ
LLLDNYQGNLTAGETISSGSGTLLSGIGNAFSLSAPGVGNDGSVDLILDLSQLTGANMEWLRPNGNDPTAKVTFGIFKGNNHLIYMRESIW